MRVFERSSVRGIKADAPVSPGAPAPVAGWYIQQQRLGEDFLPNRICVNCSVLHLGLYKE